MFSGNNCGFEECPCNECKNSPLFTSVEVPNALAACAAEYALSIRIFGFRVNILPDETKTIFYRVIDTERSALANRIKRLEETAAARGQANTAELFAENCDQLNAA